MGGRWVRVVFAGVASVVIAVGSAAPAHAHNAFAGSTPKDGAVLDQAPAAVQLRFAQKLVAANVTVSITDPAGAAAAGGTPTFDGPAVSIPLRPTSAGRYTVDYAVISADGDRVTGKIAFTLTVAAVPPPPSPTASPTPPHSAGAVVPAPRELAEESGSGTWWPWVVGGALVLAGLALVITRRARRTPAG